MMELTFFLQMCVVFFAILGFLRGVYKEFVAFIGIFISLFFLTEFDWLLDWVVGGMSAEVRFSVDAALIILMTFFSYQQAPFVFVPASYRKGNKIVLPLEKGWQRGLMGALVGGLNGYLVVGSLWYFMDQYEYPLSQLFMQPLVGSSSAAFVSNLPLAWLQQGNLLLWIVAGLFLLITIFR
jgi:uncharacterized membrane protein required for colicin V production